MEQLIKGPAEGTQLYPVLPTTVKVLDIDVADGICTVNVSKEILTDANQLGVSGSSEKLALAAIADTLTEFADVDRVALFIEGLQSGMIEGRFVEDFWGHMGLPTFLERNEEVIYQGP
jgi:spore germination protein GerM